MLVLFLGQQPPLLKVINTSGWFFFSLSHCAIRSAFRFSETEAFKWDDFRLATHGLKNGCHAGAVGAGISVLAIKCARHDAHE